MNHEAYKEKLSALLDGELDEAERADALAHLETCEACRTYFAELNALHDALGGMEELDAPEGFAESVLARLHDGEERGAWVAAKPKRRAWRGLAGLAACAAAVLLAIALPQMRMGGSSGSSAPESAMAPATAQSTLMTAGAAPAAAADAAAPESAESEAPMDAMVAEEKLPLGAARETELDEFAAEDGADGPDGDAGAGEAPTAASEQETAQASPAVLTLSGEGAADWLAENGEPLGGGEWRVTVEAVNALPDALTLTAAADIQEPEGGTLIVTLAETEAAP